MLLLFFSKKTILQQRGRRLLIPHTPDITITHSSAKLIALLLALIFTSSGCSLSYVDKKTGNHHSWGLVHSVTREIPEKDSDVIMQQVTTWGIAIQHFDERGGISFGYTRDFSLKVDDHVAGSFKMDVDNPASIQYQNTGQILKNKGEYLCCP